MKKLRLEPEELRVESFSTDAAGAATGTVRGHDFTLPNCTGGTSCYVTGCDTCDNSLDYCTCACTADCATADCASDGCDTRYNTCHCV
jgi:hypothetical protein